MINREKVYTYFLKFHGPVQPSTNGWYSCECPICGKYKFAINLDYLTGKCWRGCFNGFLIDVIQRYHGITHFETLDFIDSMESMLVSRLYQSVKKAKECELLLPQNYKPILSGDSVLAIRARNYLKGRGFDLNYLDRIGVGYCDEPSEDLKENYFGYIIIPFKCRGLIVYFIGRDFIGNQDRYKNPSKEKIGIGKGEVFFNEEAFILQNRVYLTEGWACAATIGEQGVSMQGSILGVKQRNIVIKSSIKELIIIPDAGCYINGLKMAIDLLPYKQIKVINLKHFQELELGKDVNEIGRERVLDFEGSINWFNDSTLLKALYDEKPLHSH